MAQSIVYPMVKTFEVIDTKIYRALTGSKMMTHIRHQTPSKVDKHFTSGVFFVSVIIFEQNLMG